MFDELITIVWPSHLFPTRQLGS